MLITEDLLKEHPLEALCNMINSKFFLELEPFTTKIVSLVKLTDGATEVTIDRKVSTREDNQFPKVSNKVFVYNRLNLRRLSPIVPLTLVSSELPVSLFKLLEKHCIESDIVLDKTDIEDLDIMEYDKDYSVAAGESSLRFYGDLQVKVVMGVKQSIAPATVVTFPSFYAPDNISNLSIFSAAASTYHVDFTMAREFLRYIKPGGIYTNIKELARLISKYTKLDFVSKPYIARNNLTHEVIDDLPRYNVIYNGPTGLNFPARKDLSNVLIIKLNPTYCNGMIGNLMLHYN